MDRNAAHNLLSMLSLCFLLMALVLPCHQLPAQEKGAPTITSQKTLSTFSYKIITGASGTYGYDIYLNKKLKIHQPTVPALSGNDGFKTEAAAEKVARLVIAKMKKGETFPTVSIAEMQKLHVVP